MTEETTLRLRLQTVAAYRELRRNVQKSGRENVIFALVMLGLAYFAHQNGQNTFVALIYVALGLGELLVGLFKWAVPSAEGLILDGMVLLVFAALNFGREFLRFQGGAQPTSTGIFFGLLMLYFAVGRFKNYAALRRLFAERPAPEHIAWFDDLVRDILTSDPHADQLALDLPTTPHWRVKLLGSTAFFVANNGGSVWVVGPDDFVLVREKHDRGGGRRKALLRIYGDAYPEFTLDDVSWANYARWMDEFAAPHPA
ncbi:hypothetical protein VT84_38595 [Gemmata sp. SH-PL17]|uniref:hypothetical protein n=1 Tax=Gemmata sp. SH-PL17 TaxID=1630693 RepID=UPI0004B843AF|nr:hypothetical protein [Gemmata sp. SH-PL17]AMV30366.1 hypothetical protein VT84_38595 [Gemmata sp. SH-PL17]